MQLSEQAKALEQAAAEQDKEFLLKETGHFLEEWRSYKEKLAVCIQQGAQKEITDLPHILELLQALKESMEILDVDLADEQMRELRQYQYPDTVSEKMGALSTAVVNLDSQKADELIDAIVELL